MFESCCAIESAVCFEKFIFNMQQFKLPSLFSEFATLNKYRQHN